VLHTVDGVSALVASAAGGGDGVVRHLGRGADYTQASRRSHTPGRRFVPTDLPALGAVLDLHYTGDVGVGPDRTSDDATTRDLASHRHLR